jgi:hypothetical protein
MNHEELAEKRVNDTPELKTHSDTIFYDWNNWDEHVEWVATAPIEEIIEWAAMVEGYAERDEMERHMYQ